MAHLAVILDRAKRRSGLFQPFPCGPHGIAALRTLAFEHPGFLLLRRGRLSVRVETGMGEGASVIEDRRYRPKVGDACSSDERSLGKARVGTGSYRWSPSHSKHKHHKLTKK